MDDAEPFYPHQDSCAGDMEDAILAAALNLIDLHLIEAPSRPDCHRRERSPRQVQAMRRPGETFDED